MAVGAFSHDWFISQIYPVCLSAKWAHGKEGVSLTWTILLAPALASQPAPPPPTESSAGFHFKSMTALLPCAPYTVPKCFPAIRQSYRLIVPSSRPITNELASFGEKHKEVMAELWRRGRREGGSPVRRSRSLMLPSAPPMRTMWQ